MYNVYRLNAKKQRGECDVMKSASHKEIAELFDVEGAEFSWLPNKTAKTKNLNEIVQTDVHRSTGFLAYHVWYDFVTAKLQKSLLPHGKKITANSIVYKNLPTIPLPMAVYREKIRPGNLLVLVEWDETNGDFHRKYYLYRVTTEIYNIGYISGQDHRRISLNTLNTSHGNNLSRLVLDWGRRRLLPGIVGVRWCTPTNYDARCYDGDEDVTFGGKFPGAECFGNDEFRKWIPPNGSKIINIGKKEGLEYWFVFNADNEGEFMELYNCQLGIISSSEIPDEVVGKFIEEFPSQIPPNILPTNVTNAILQVTGNLKD